jgi:hypothetical protein
MSLELNYAIRDRVSARVVEMRSPCAFVETALVRADPDLRKSKGGKMSSFPKKQKATILN